MPRPPKTSDELKKNGTFRPAYHADRKAFELLKDVPPPPDTFDKARTDYWNHFCSRLISSGLLTAQHLDAVKMLCSLHVDLDELNKQIQAEGITFHTDSGQIKANPAYALKLQTQAQILSTYDKFGFTPRASMNFKNPPQAAKETDPFEELVTMMKANDKPGQRPKA